MKNSLPELRVSINDIDQQLIDLYLKRMEIVKEIALYKEENNVSVDDAKREEDMEKRYLLKIKNNELKKYFPTFLKGVITASKDYQKDIIKK